MKNKVTVAVSTPCFRNTELTGHELAHPILQPGSISLGFKQTVEFPSPIWQDQTIGGRERLNVVQRVVAQVRITDGSATIAAKQYDHWLALRWRMP